MRRTSGARAGAGIRLMAIALAASAAAALPAGAQTNGRVTITIAATIMAEPARETPLPIEVGPGEAIPRNSFLRVRGLPATVALTEGHSVAPGSWAVPLQSLAGLRIVAPAGSGGRSEVTISLVAIDGTPIAEAKSVLILTPASALVQGQADQRAPPVQNMALGARGVPPPVAAERPAARPSPPPPPPSAALPPEVRERALRHMAKGEEQLASGDIAAARLLYQKAAELGWAAGAMALAATYDPGELARLKVRGVQPDPATARRWYEKARELGATEADARLSQLGQR